mgnify:CR=1 FL=1
MTVQAVRVQVVCDSNTFNVQRVNDIGISFVGLYPRDLGLEEERTDRWAQTGPQECQNFGGDKLL